MSQIALQEVVQEIANSLRKEVGGVHDVPIVVEADKVFKKRRRIAFYHPSRDVIIVRPDYPRQVETYPTIIKAIRKEMIKAHNQWRTNVFGSKSHGVLKGIFLFFWSDVTDLWDRAKEFEGEALCVIWGTTYVLLFGFLVVVNWLISGDVNGSPFSGAVGVMVAALPPVFSIGLLLNVSDGIREWMKRRRGALPPAGKSEDTWFENGAAFIMGIVIFVLIVFGLLLWPLTLFF